MSDRSPMFVRAGEGDSFSILGGDVVTIKVSGAQTGEAFALVETFCPPGGGPPPHVHDREDETFYVVQGEFAFHTPTGVVKSGPGGVVHLPRGLPHYFRNIGSEPGTLVIAVHPAGFERFVEEFSSVPADLPPDMDRIGAIAAKYGITFAPMF